MQRLDHTAFEASHIEASGVAWRDRVRGRSKIALLGIFADLELAITYIPRDMTGLKLVQWLCQLAQGLWTAHTQYPAPKREVLRQYQGNEPFAI